MTLGGRYADVPKPGASRAGRSRGGYRATLELGGACSEFHLPPERRPRWRYRGPALALPPSQWICGSLNPAVTDARVQAVQDHIVAIAPRPAAPSVYVGDRPDMQAVSTSGGTWAACLNQTHHRTR